MQLELLHQAFQLTLNPIFDASQPGFDCGNSKGEKLNFHARFSEIAADDPGKEM